MACKILIVVNPSIGGVEYHRQLIPHYKINELPGFEVTQINEIDSAPDDFLKQFHIVFMCRLAGHTTPPAELLSKLRRLGVKSILDIDDYWELSNNHLLRADHVAQKVAPRITESIRYADHITTTTTALADRVKPYNRNITILENAIDPDQPQFKTRQTLSGGRVRFGWLGGICHLEDIRILRHSFHSLHTDDSLQGKYELILGGYNESDNTGTWKEFERIFTSGLDIMDKPSWPYTRMNASNAYTYASGYNYLDVALAPLNGNLFNSCKSELKMIEAGFMRKAMIVSDVLPYSLLAVHGTNCLTVSQSRYRKGWYERIARLINNPALVSDLADGLYETVRDKYHIKTVNQKRVELYNHLINK